MKNSCYSGQDKVGGAERGTHFALAAIIKR